MKKLLYQTSQYFNEDIRLYGCLFISLYYWSPVSHSYSELNAIWDSLKDAKAINSDCVIVDYAKVLSALGIDADYREGHWAPDTPVAENQFAVGEFYWKTAHFSPVSRNKKLIYVVKPDSSTIRYGTLRTLRIFTWRNK